MIVYQGAASVDTTKSADFVLSMWVNIPAGFRGLMVCPQIGDVSPSALYPASMIAAGRGSWQLIWAQVTIPFSRSQIHVRLLVIGEADSTLQSACWKLERGHTPSLYQTN
jgi:hypothetical protein